MIIIKDGLLSQVPDKISYEELGALIMICKALSSKDNLLKVTDKILTNYLGFGRDKHDRILNNLIAKKLISRSQQRDTSGKFTFNLIKLITDQIEI
jgi:hypothetical protein